MSLVYVNVPVSNTGWLAVTDGWLLAAGGVGAGAPAFVVVAAVGSSCGLPSPVPTVAAGVATLPAAAVAAVVAASVTALVGATALSGAAGAAGERLHADTSSPPATSMIETRFRDICTLLFQIRKINLKEKSNKP